LPHSPATRVNLLYAFEYAADNLLGFFARNALERRRATELLSESGFLIPVNRFDVFSMYPSAASRLMKSFALRG
jgi:hypothetical protein